MENKAENIVLLEWVRERIALKHPYQDIRKDLIERGLSEEEADEMVRAVDDVRVHHARGAGLITLAVGVAVLIAAWLVARAAGEGGFTIAMLGLYVLGAAITGVGLIRTITGLDLLKAHV